MEKIRFVRNENPSPKPKDEELGFGNIFTDHMFVMDYDVDRVGTILELFPMVLLKWSPPLWCSTMVRLSLKV